MIVDSNILDWTSVVPSEISLILKSFARLSTQSIYRKKKNFYLNKIPKKLAKKCDRQKHPIIS